MMTLAKALKLKNTQAKKVSGLLAKAISKNSHDMGIKNSYNTRTLLDEYYKERAYLIDIKKKIADATSPIREAIIESAELKIYAQSLARMDTASGVIANAYSAAAPREFTAEILEEEKDKMVEEVEAQIQTLQEKIDVFNHTTQIDL